jgi:hypothetical protein
VVQILEVPFVSFGVGADHVFRQRSLNRVSASWAASTDIAPFSRSPAKPATLGNCKSLEAFSATQSAKRLK